MNISYRFGSGIEQFLGIILVGGFAGGRDDHDPPLIAARQRTGAQQATKTNQRRNWHFMKQDYMGAHQVRGNKSGIVIDSMREVFSFSRGSKNRAGEVQQPRVVYSTR